ncbi:MAG TPA: hypothetical protein VGB66_10035 [Longimicrobium sp.]
MFFLDQSVMTSVIESLIVLISHVIYFGPVVLLLFFGRPFTRAVQEHGAGCTPFVSINVSLASSPQSVNARGGRKGEPVSRPAGPRGDAVAGRAGTFTALQHAMR